jgi:hypothetical protein
MGDEDNQKFMLIDKPGMNDRSWTFFHHFPLKIKISYDFQIIPQLFYFYSRAKNYSKTPQNGIEIIPFGDPGLKLFL